MTKVAHQTSRIRAITLQPVVDGPWLPAPLSRSLLGYYGMPDVTDNPYNWVSLGASALLLEDAASALDDPCLGARIGTCFLPEQAGPFGALYATCRTLRDVYIHYRRFARLIQDASLLEVEIGPEVAIFSYRILDTSITARRQDAELTASTVCNFARSVLGTSWSPLEVQFEHMPDGDPAQVRSILRAPVSYGHSINRVLISTADVDRINPRATPTLVPIVLQHLEDLLSREDRAVPLLDQLRIFIAKHLADPCLSLADAASDLGLPARTLQRRLAEDGIGFRALVEEARRDAAGRMLRERHPIKTIAYALGYTEPSVFSRACRSWTGKSPRAVRRAALLEEPGSSATFSPSLPDGREIRSSH